jgi:hypothetical protein
MIKLFLFAALLATLASAQSGASTVICGECSNLGIKSEVYVLSFTTVKKPCAGAKRKIIKKNGRIISDEPTEELYYDSLGILMVPAKCDSVVIRYQCSNSHKFRSGE